MDFTRSAEDLDATLDAARRVGDVLADAAVAELISAGAMRAAGGDLVGALERHARAGGRAAQALMEHCFTVPSWVRFPEMKVGAQLGLRTPMQSSVSLILGSLMESYGSAKGAKVLIRGGMLTKHVLQRLRDTTTFVLEIAASRAPMPGTTAHRHVVRTRLVHAFVRHGMLKRGDWNIDWGHPVNQEDSASTLLVFCHVYLRSMARLGATPTAEEEASVHHLYRWVGHLMGITPELLTVDRAQEQQLYAHITRRQLHPDADSRVLAHSLISALASRRPLFLPANALAAISRHLLGDTLADGLGLTESRSWTTVAHAMPLLCRAQLRVEERAPFTRFPLEHLGERVARLVYERGFELPSET
ncbi:MAG: oxygenase MpaB family protein [Myxococcales bacterium]|nr:oxygenase MpaB family protein [Myxococcales bacterium]